jgi:hypothetical protein
VHPDVISGLNGGVPPTGRPLEVAVVAAIRGGKSLLAGATALHCSQLIDVSKLGPGDTPRFASVSIKKDLGYAVFEHLQGNLLAKPKLRELLVEEPTDGRLLVRHPTGRPVEVVVSAGSRAGGSLVGRWLAGVVFDEFALMSGEGEAVINWDEQRKAVRNRILPGGVILHIGSPWAPFGPAFAMVRDSWGKPTRSLVVVKAPGPAMNPNLWTPERVAQAIKDDPDAAQMTVLAEFGTPATSMYSDVSLKACTRAELALPGDPRQSYTAAIDPASRGNGFTLVVATRVGAKRIIVLAQEWRGSKAVPLDLDDVLREIAELLAPYRIEFVETDQWAADPLRALAKRHGVKLVDRSGESQDEVFDRYKAFAERLELGEVELPPEPQLQADLRRVQKRVTTRGFAVHLPHTSDGRHCDFAPATMLALGKYLRDTAIDPPAPGTKEAHEAEAAKHRAEQLRVATRAKKPFWKRKLGSP